MGIIVQIGTHNDPDSLERYHSHLRDLAHGKYKGDDKKAYRKEL